MKETHYKDIMCQTEHKEVIYIAIDKCPPLKCKYICFYCGCDKQSSNLQMHKTECCEAEFVTRDLMCDTSYIQSYSFPVLPPFGEVLQLQHRIPGQKWAERTL